MMSAMTGILFFCYTFTLCLGYLLRALNLGHLKRCGADIPPGFEGAVDKELLARTSAYTLERSRVGLFESLSENFLLIIIFFGGLLGVYDRWLASLDGSFIMEGVLFFLGFN